MNLVLNLPPELESELASEATKLGLPLAEYALRLLASGHAQNTPPRNGTELLAYWQRVGVIGTRTDISDSSEEARRLREQAQHRAQP